MHSATEQAAAVGDRSFVCDPRCDPDWNAKMERFDAATAFHTANWASTLVDCYNFTPAYVVAGDPQAPSTVLPTMEIRPLFRPKRAVALPFTDSCETLSSGAETARVDGLTVSHGRRRGWASVEFRRRAPGDVAAETTSYLGHVINLEHSEAELFARCSDAARRAVNRAGKLGVTVEVATDIASLQTFYRLLCLTRKRHGAPPQPWRFFQALHRNLLAKDLGCVVLARHGGTPVAASVFLRFGRSALFKYGASNLDYQHLRGSNAAMWAGIRHHAQLGCTRLDLGRTSVRQEGLRQFKLGWGATEHGIAYTRVNCATAVASPVREPSRRWVAQIFQRIPTPLARLIGAALYAQAA